MVRHHIAQGARLFIERRAVFDSHRFSSGDLYIVDVIPVPHRFEERITEAENEDVLHCFFAKIVVNPVHRFSSNTPCTTSFSTFADSRSRPKGFSKTIRVHPLSRGFSPTAPNPSMMGPATDAGVDT